MQYSELIGDYLDDAAGHLSAFDNGLLEMEKNGPSGPLIDGILGSLHTLKGNSGMMGFDGLKTYIHEVEGLLKAVREGTAELDSVMDALLTSANVIRGFLSAIEKDPASLPDLDPQGLRAPAILGLRAPTAGTACHGKGLQAPSVAATLQSYLGTRTDTIRVDFKRLDDLLNLMGELLIFKTRLGQIQDRVRAELESKPLRRELSEGVQMVEKTVSLLQEKVMKMRMLPVRTVFSRFPRMVRDIAGSQGKQVSLSVSGEDVELDKTVIDHLGEPLIHILRNAIDHGIEPPEERTGKGKTPAGKIHLSASQESNYVIIKVQDDGRGMDHEALKRKALEKGFIKEEETPGGDELLQLIFAPGFTTKEETSEISGRGIGLDVVRRNISLLNGHVFVENRPGAGCAFTIKLPLSLAIIPALMAEAGGELYAIPLGAVDESVKVKEEAIHNINNREVVTLRGQVLPVVRLQRFFNLPNRGRKRLYLIVVRKAEKRLALAVDRLRGRQEIVIKPMDEAFGKSAGIAGASILGDGKVVLIVDTLALWEGGATQIVKEEVFSNV